MAVIIALAQRSMRSRVKYISLPPRDLRCVSCWDWSAMQTAYAVHDMNVYW